MLIRALSKRDKLNAFVTKCERERDTAKRISKKDQLTSDNWLILAETVSILKPFYTLTMRLQSRAKDAHYSAI
jgi:hypothetical protein